MINWDQLPDKQNSGRNPGEVSTAKQAADNQNNLSEKSDQISSIEPVRASDKRVINGSSDINQLAPFQYPWAWNYFINANKNHWTPLDINMAQTFMTTNTS